MAKAKSAEPAAIKLTAFAVYKKRVAHPKCADDIEIIAGASDVKVDPATGRVQLLASSIPLKTASMRSRVPQPGFGMFALYGHRDALDELFLWRGIARKANAEFAFVEFEAVVHELSTQLIDREAIKASEGRLRFANLRRCKVDLQKEILESFAGYVEEEGGNAEETMSNVVQIATRPDLCYNLLSQDPDFKDITVFVTPVADDPDVPGRMRQIAFVKPGVEVANVVQGDDSCDLLLPAWLTDEPLAKKFREGSFAEAT
ncbi:MAG: hypothetical protein O9327_15040 [Polaromonas sp.]|nr:hypothetical protein [Polaromonas sp.]